MHFTVCLVKHEDCCGMSCDKLKEGVTTNITRLVDSGIIQDLLISVQDKKPTRTSR